ncbi:MAG TPA: Vps62-related protein [Kofleriaceae bacterium]|nr:Vps62-related protein [Kofleriaceae bacterium]
MRRLASLLLVIVGCTHDAPAFEPTDPTDSDEDGLPDQLEDHVMALFGPELRLPPDDIDWTRPANVDWYLPQVHMRFDQAGCPDDAILDDGAVTFDSIHAQDHFKKQSGLGLCQTSTNPADERFSNQKATEFFLQPSDDAAVHPGIPPERSAEWRAYIQVRPSTYVRASDGQAAAYDLQVWYFFPYNDAVSVANHEADWEHLTIAVSADFDFVSAFFATHGDGHRVDDAGALTFVDDTHLAAYIADGTHATYESPGDHPGPVVDDHCYDGGPIWQTWSSYANLGQIGHVIGNQTWARYGGRWGEVGASDVTSGPVGPMFNGKWNTETEY